MLFRSYEIYDAFPICTSRLFLTDGYSEGLAARVHYSVSSQAAAPQDSFARKTRRAASQEQGSGCSRSATATESNPFKVCHNDKLGSCLILVFIHQLGVVWHGLAWLGFYFLFWMLRRPIVVLHRVSQVSESQYAEQNARTRKEIGRASCRERV